jgi:hypothetical protein
VSFQHFADDVSVAQALATEAMNYAEQAVKTDDSSVTSGSAALVTLNETRQAIAAGRPAVLGSNAVAGALRDLQIAAVAFTVQLAISDSRAVNETSLRQLEDKLFALFDRQGAVRLSSVVADVAAAQRLGDSALAYAQQIIIAEDSNAPIGSPPVAGALSDLHVAALKFTVQIAISEGADPKSLRRIEKKLIKRFKRQEDER